MVSIYTRMEGRTQGKCLALFANRGHVDHLCSLHTMHFGTTERHTELLTPSEYFPKLHGAHRHNRFVSLRLK